MYTSPSPDQQTIFQVRKNRKTAATFFPRENLAYNTYPVSNPSGFPRQSHSMYVCMYQMHQQYIKMSNLLKRSIRLDPHPTHTHIHTQQGQTPLSPCLSPICPLLVRSNNFTRHPSPLEEPASSSTAPAKTAMQAASMYRLGNEAHVRCVSTQDIVPHHHHHHHHHHA